MRAMWRSRWAAILACLMIAPATWAATHHNAAEMSQQFAADWGDPDAGFYLYPAPFVDRDCDDFRTRARAQAFFDSRVARGKDRHGLDRDDDLVACEGFEY